jgi:quinol monooxygenase YgiN
VIIVSGSLQVDEAERDAYLRSCHELMVTARRTPGCLDFYLVADPLEPGRIDVYEQWESVEAVEAFRGSGPSSEQQAQILDARVVQHEVAGSSPL